MNLSTEHKDAQGRYVCKISIEHRSPFGTVNHESAMKLYGYKEN